MPLLNFTDKNISSTIENLSQKFDVVGILNFINLSSLDWVKIYHSLKKLHKDRYEPNERILIVMDRDWYHETDDKCGMLLTALQRMINKLDISNCFIELITTNQNVASESAWIQTHVSQDPTDINITVCQDTWATISGATFTKFDTSTPVDTISNLDDWADSKHYNLLFNNPSFCMAPWTHLSVSTDQTVNPC